MKNRIKHKLKIGSIAAALFLFFAAEASCYRVDYSPFDTAKEGIEGAVSMITQVEVAQLVETFVAPLALTFPASGTLAFTQGAAQTVSPTVRGSSVTCSVLPALPAGLTLDAATCAISGTPVAVQISTPYTVILSNSREAVTADITIEILTGVPTLAYTGSPFTFSRTVTIANLIPAKTGADAVSCTSAPALPSGLTINNTTCVISGTPNTLQGATAHTITLNTAYGSVSPVINITVQDIPPSGLSYAGSPFVFDLNTAITAVTPTIGGGTPSTCSAAPPLPAGLAINNTTCAITGTPTALQAAANHTITASNAYGNTNTVINVAVIPPAVGGQVTGFYGGGTLVLQNNGGDNLTITGNGPFEFATRVLPGTGITVTVGTQPSPQSCTVYADATAIPSPTVTMPSNHYYDLSVVCGSAGLPIKDSGMTYCLDQNGNLIPCAGTGQDGEFVDVPAARSFTGPTAHVTYTADRITTDNVTGLIWKSCIQGLSGANCNTGIGTSFLNVIDAMRSCRALNFVNGGAGYWGRKDWRLPVIKELDTIPNYGNQSPAIDTAFFPNTDLSDYYSSDPSIAFPGKWFTVRMFSGLTLDTTFGGSVARCVAGGNGFVRLFTDNSNGTITDQQSGLIWQKCSRGQTNDAACSGAAAPVVWTTALSYCNGLTLASRSDWRLPNINELQSISDIQRSSPLIDPLYFPSTVGGIYWSSTSSQSGNAKQNVDFSNGRSSSVVSSSSNNVRCVTGP